jgi:hypothetical protein
MLLNGSVIRKVEEKQVDPWDAPTIPESPVTDTGSFSLEIKPLKTVKSKIKQRTLMEKDIIPRHPSSVIFNGSSGSGKSVLLLNMLTRPEFFKGYFDEIHLFSPTGASDDLFDALKLPEENIHIDMKPSELSDILEEQRDKIEADGVDKVKKMLIIFEDVQGNSKFMRSKPFLKSFIANRHYGISTWLCGQSWTRTPKACRLQANNIFYFAGSGSENELLANEHTPPGMRKREFMEMLMQGTRNKYDFVHINLRAPHAERYRRNLGNLINWKQSNDE